MGLLALLKQYDLNSTTQERKEQIIKEIQQLYYSHLSFYYPKPINVQISKEEENIQMNKQSDTLDENIFDINKIIEEYIKNPDERILNQINMEYFFDYVDITKLPETFFIQWIINQRFNLSPSQMNQEALKRLAKFIDAYSQKNLYPPHINHILNKMTISQISELSELITTQIFDKSILFAELLNKQFYSQFSHCQNENEKREIYIQIYNSLENKPTKFNSLKSRTLFIILDLGIKLNNYDLDLFIKFVKNPSILNESLYKLNIEQKNNIQTQTKHQIFQEEVLSIPDENKLVNQYLEHFFLFQNLKMEIFEEFVNNETLKRVYYTSLLLKGEESEEIIKHLNKFNYEELVKKKEITICKHNKNNFDVEENVVLAVDIKNIQTLFVKIFEINTENYYYNKKTTLNTAISLEGLITSYEETFSFNEKPQKLVRRNFEFEKIPNRRGIYIVDFIGGGYSSRAIIKKGSLSLVTRSSAKGKMIFILNEKSEICKSESTGVWFKDTFYQCDKEMGHIIIPYMRQTYNEPCILIHDNFAEIAKLEVTEEKYEIKGVFHVNHESFIMGNTAKILFRPYLYVNGRETKVEYLKNCKIITKMIKSENDAVIPISNVFDNLTVNNEKEIEFELQIPPKLTRVEFVFEAQVKNLSKEKNDELNLSHYIDMSSKNDDNNAIKMFFNKSEDNFKLSALGKNGEPKSNLLINFSFNLNNLSKIITQSLETNSNGEVYLGKLKDVKSFSVTYEYLFRHISENWKVPQNIQFHYPTNLDILENESISLPFDEDYLDIRNVRFYKINNKNEILEELLNLLKLESVNENKTRFNIKISALEQGSYVLYLKKRNLTIDISVHQGKVWTNNFIIKRDKIIENTEFLHPIYIKDVKIEENKNLKIQVQTQSKRARVHILIHQFLLNESFTYSEEMIRLLSSGNYHSEHSFQSWSNFYLSNRLLNEEVQYVFDRKYLERCLGNSLEKPSLLLKRQYVRDTTTEQEQLEGGTEFQDKKIELLNEKAKKMKMNHTIIKKNSFYSDFHNFLAHSPITLFNCPVDKDGFVKLNNLPLDKFSHLQIIAVDEKSVCEEIISLNNSNKFEKRDLTLSKCLNPSKTYSELRKIQLLNNEQKVLISDITSTSFKIIDSLEKVVNFKFLLNPSLQSSWNPFSFLLKFNELSEEEQKKKYSNFFSHEMNIFLYFKFPNLFEKYVKPVLNYKIEKTFIDFFLLDDKESLNKFYNPVRINSLNAFEKCLLIISLKNENEILARHIRNSMFTKADEIKLGDEEHKRIFNIVMNMKAEDDNLGGEGVIPRLTESINQPYGDNFASDFISMAPQSNMFNMVQSYMNVQPNFNQNNNFTQQIQQQPALFGASSFASPRVFNTQMMKENAFEECENYNDDYEQNSDDYIEKINVRNNLYKNAGVSKEYQETHYYNKINNSIISENLFWVDLADHILNNTNQPINKNFLSKNILMLTNDVTELIFILSVLDLPFTQTHHQFNRLEGRALEIQSSSNLLILTKEITESNSEINSNLMIAQTLTEYNDNENEDKVIKEFLINRIYVHDTIVTNISSNKISFELLIQVPEGSIPVLYSEYTKTIHLSLDKFNTRNFKTYFYFPERVGEYIQYPPNAAVEGIVIAKGETLIYKVVDKITQLSKESLDDILINGNKTEILEFLNDQEKLNVNDLTKVFWLLKEKDFYLGLIQILRRKGIYNKEVWSFAFNHMDIFTISEYLNLDNNIIQSLGPKFQSNLININETNNFNVMNHLDYNPIFNARVHRLGKESNVAIMNKEFKQTYEKFVIYLLRLNPEQIDAKSWIRLCYYLILQDRIEEALRIFSKINTVEFNENSSLLVQYDYIAAFLDFSIGYPDFKIAKEICIKYKDFPLTHWRELFEEIEDQLIEYEGKEVNSDIDAIIDEEKKKKQMIKNIIQCEPTLSFSIENKTLQIVHSNLDNITVKFYLIDLEILFSRAPFIKSNSDDFSYVQPNFVKELNVDNSINQELLTFPIPQEFLSKNLFIEVSSQHKKTFETYFSTNLKVTISENLGEIKITDDKLKPLNKVYVKCFAKMNDSTVKFYKDGYTDLRGKFNYISLNTDQLKSLERFSVFILHDEFGSIIKECKPPANIQKDSGFSDYDNIQNYKQEVRQMWRNVNKQK